LKGRVAVEHLPGNILDHNANIGFLVNGLEARFTLIERSRCTFILSDVAAFSQDK